MYKKLLSTLAFSCMVLLLGAQTVFTITGSVLFGQTDTGVPGITVDLLYGNFPMESTTTNDDGSYVLNGDVDFADLNAFSVGTLDICTGEYLVVNLPTIGPNTAFVVDFVVCDGIDPPPPPEGCEAWFHYESSGSTTGTELAFFDISYSDQEITQWLWSTNGETIGSEQNLVYDFGDYGEYEVTLTISNEDCTSSVTQIVYVVDPDNCNCDETEIDPVCVATPSGSILTFPNACFAICAGYDPDIFYECDGCQCDIPVWNPVCVLGEDGTIITFDNTCYAECQGYGPDDFVPCDGECDCPDIWDPVCVNGFAGIITFGNACEAICQGFTEADFVDCEETCEWICALIDGPPVCVMTASGEIIQFDNSCYAECEGFGPDSYVPCDGGCDCPDVWDPVCVNGFAGLITFGNACEAECQGFTEADFVDCEENCEWLCGNIDGPPVCVMTASGVIITFDNACYAECEGFGPDSFVDCDGVCTCPEIWDPVCVIDPTTGEVIVFSNACFAECEGYTPDEYGPCQDECECDDIYDPVCVLIGMCDYLTFDNACFAECAGFTPDMFVECDPVCDCPADVWDPVCVEAGPFGIFTFPNACEALCFGFTEEDFVDCGMDCICPQVWDPVCVIAENGDIITFQNECYAACEGYGPDSFVECIDDCICPDVWDPVCVNGDFGPITYGNPCEAMCDGFTEEDFVECEDGCLFGCADFFGPPVCVMTADGVIIEFINECYAICEGYSPDTFIPCDDCICPDVWDPVCVVTSTGIITFGNACEAMCEGFTEDDFVECEDDCICPDVWDPVCVATSTGIITFGNACEAICEGFTEDDFVDCEDDCNCFLIYDPVCVIDPSTGDVIEFQNACFAECEGYTDYFPCNGPPTCFADFSTEFATDNGLTVQFTDLSFAFEEITSWSWDFGDGNESSEQHPLHTYAESGVYDVVLTISNVECTATIVHHICVGEGGGVNGPDCQAMFFFQQSDPDDLMTFDFFDISLGAATGWAWDFGDGTTSTEQNPSHTYEAGGQYAVSLSINGDDCESSVVMLVATDNNIWYGNGECQAWFLPIIDPTTNSVFFINLSSPDATTFEWNFGDGTTSSDPLAFHAYEEPGEYTITLTTTNANGCTSEFVVTLNIGGDSDGFDGGPVFSLVNSTDDVLDDSAISISPNPTTGNAVVKWSSTTTGSYNWKIYDMSGRMLQSNTAQNDGETELIPLDLSALQGGMYLFRIETAQGTKTLKVSKL